MCGDVGCAPIGDIVAIKAKPKNGKSLLATVIASVILGAEFGDLKPTIEDTSVMYFDTEQNKANTALVMERIYNLCGWEKPHPNRLRVYALRKMAHTQRLEYIKEKIRAHKPTAVVIDGIADIMSDFNDIKESSDIIQDMMELSAENNTVIFFILHTNKSDSSMKGHLGSFALQKCSDAFEVTKKGDTFNVTHTDTRNIQIKDFSFIMDSNGMPASNDNKERSGSPDSKDLEIVEMLEALEDIYTQENSTSITRKELTKLIKEKTNKTTKDVRKMIRTAVESSILEEQDGRLTLML
jgi:hypothetical protein